MLLELIIWGKGRTHTQTRFPLLGLLSEPKSYGLLVIFSLIMLDSPRLLLSLKSGLVRAEREALRLEQGRLTIKIESSRKTWMKWTQNSISSAPDMAKKYFNYWFYWGNNSFLYFRLIPGLYYGSDRFFFSKYILNKLRYKHNVSRNNMILIFKSLIYATFDWPI